MTKTHDDGQEPVQTSIPEADVSSSLPPGQGAGPAERGSQGSGVRGDTVPAWVSDPAAAYAEIQKLRDEAGRHRTRANQLEAELETAAFDKAAQSDALDALRAAMRAGEVRAAVLLEAARAGIADPSDALALADLSAVSVGDDGQVTGARQAVEALAAAKPYLVSTFGGPATAQGSLRSVRAAPALSPTNPGSGPALRPDDLRALSSEAIARMDPDELHAALSAGPQA